MFFRWLLNWKLQVYTTSRKISHENLSLNYEKIQLIIIVRN